MASPNSIFVDTSGWASLFLPSESYHLQAKEAYQLAVRQAQRMNTLSVFTTNYVLGELIPLITSRKASSRQQLLTFIDLIKTAPYVRVVYVNKELDDISWLRLKQRQDKEWSLVDASSFIVMERLRLQQALTTDHHFEQAGFIRLLK